MVGSIIKSAVKLSKPLIFYEIRRLIEVHFIIRKWNALFKTSLWNKTQSTIMGGPHHLSSKKSFRIGT